MIKNLKKSVLLTVYLVMLFGIAYPLFIYVLGLALPLSTEGNPIYRNGKIVGFENIGQSFTQDKYFWGRPSAVNYNTASTGGSNKGPSNPEYLAEVKARIDTFLVHNPGIKKEDIPSELVTASGSGIDPHISPEGAYIQVSRIAKTRNIDPQKIRSLIQANILTPVFGLPVINVLKLNLALDELK